MPTSACVIIAITAVAVIGIILFAWRFLTPRETSETPPPPRVYEITLYSGGEVAKSFRSEQVSSGDAKGYARVQGNTEYSIFGGSFVIEPVDSKKTTVRTAETKYVVTLYSGNKAVREWYAKQISSGAGKIYIKPEGATEYTIIGGTFIAEPLN